MKISAFIAISWAVLTLGCLSAPAQESSREMGPVDASVHASVEDQPRGPEASRGAAKNSTTLSSWSSQPAKKGGATTGWTAQSTRAKTTGSNVANRLSFSSFQPGGQAQDATRPPQVLPEPGVAAPLNGRPFEIQEFPSSFKKQQSGLTDSFSKAGAFPGKGLKAKQRKLRPPRSMDFGVSDPVRSTAGGKH